VTRRDERKQAGYWQKIANQREFLNGVAEQLGIENVPYFERDQFNSIPFQLFILFFYFIFCLFIYSFYLFYFISILFIYITFFHFLIGASLKVFGLVWGAKDFCGGKRREGIAG
jgi:hypothetical protein